jgi:hypothetical protein
MVGGSRSLGAVVAAGILAIAAGCAQTSRVDDDLTTAALAQTGKAVAVMRVGAASPSCLHVTVLLGVREGQGYRARKRIQVVNVRSVTEPAVAEFELEPGEYHVLAYGCYTERSIKAVGDAAGGQLYGTSFASFVLNPGEIVNVGYLHIGVSRYGRNAFGRPVRVDIDVTDWPLNELDRFKARRPQIYAQMTTRLMSVTPRGSAPPGPEDCARLSALKAEGKVQELPPACAEKPPRKRKAAAVANPAGNG